MTWDTVRTHFPNQWVLVEALAAHSETNKRILDDIAVLDSFLDSQCVMEAYQRLHQQFPEREIVFYHTSHEKLDIVERHWHGIRAGV